MTEGGNFRVLVVDDDEIAVAAISNVLTEAGCSVSNLSTPIGVSQVAIDLNVDVVILDLHMPALPGDRLAAMLRGNKRLQDIPVIIVSAAPDHELAAITKRLPGVYALPKRRVRKDLAQVVRTLAVRRRSDPNTTSPFIEQNLFAANTGTSMMPGPNATAEAQPKPVVGAVADEFRVTLPRRLINTVKLWREASCGSVRSYQDLVRELYEIRGECQLLEMEALSELVSAVEALVGALRPGASACGGTSATVLAGLNLVARVARGSGDAREKELAAVIERLNLERRRLLDSVPVVELTDSRLSREKTGAV